MVEKNFQSLFKQWLAVNPPKAAAVYELKLEKGRSIAFDRVYDHQTDSLLRAKRTGGLYYKISDTPFNHSAGFRFHKPKPFDCMFLKDMEAYVVILFYVPRATKRMLFIDIDDWIKEKSTSDRKSLTQERAEEISKHIKLLSV